MDEIRECEGCGAEVGLNHKFCSNCGTPRSLEKSNLEYFRISCPSCGTSLKVQEKFCHQCGRKVSASEEQGKFCFWWCELRVGLVQLVQQSWAAAGTS